MPATHRSDLAGEKGAFVEQRNLGKSGLRVSVVGLGCNNFGGRIDLEATRQGRAQGARSRHHTFSTRRTPMASRGRLRDVPRPDPRRPPQGHRAGHQVRPPDGRRRPAAGRLAPLHHGRGRGEPEAAQDRLDRPLPTAPARSADPDRGDACARSTTSCGRARSATSAARPCRPGRSSRRSGRRRISACTISSRAKRSTACSHRDLDREMMPVIESLRPGPDPVSPLADGLLTGKYRRGAPLPAGTRLATMARAAERNLTDENWAIVERLEAFCRRARPYSAGARL